MSKGTDVRSDSEHRGKVSEEGLVLGYRVWEAMTTPQKELGVAWPKMSRKCVVDHAEETGAQACVPEGLCWYDNTSSLYC